MDVNGDRINDLAHDSCLNGKLAVSVVTPDKHIALYHLHGCFVVFNVTFSDDGVSADVCFRCLRRSHQYGCGLVETRT